MLTILYALSALILVVISAVVIVSDSKKLVNQLFTAFVLTALVWLASNHVVNFSENADTALIGVQFTVASSLLMALFFVGFTSAYSEKKLRLNRVLVLSTITLIQIILAFTSITIESVTARAESLVVGPGYWLMAATLVVYFGYGSYLLYQRRKNSSGKLRTQATYMLIGIIITFSIGFAANALLPIIGLDEYSSYGALSVTVFSFLAFISIVRHNLFDIRRFVVRSLAYVMIIAIFLALYLFFGTLIAQNVLDIDISATQQVFYISIAIILALIYQPLKRLIDRLTNRIFYRDVYDTQEALNKFSDFLVAELDTRNIIDHTLDILNDSLRPSKSSILLYEPKEKSWHDMDGSLRNTVRKKLSKTLEYQSKPILITDELEQENLDPFTKNILEVLKTEYVLVSVRLSTKNQLVGFLLLGSKKSGGDYTAQDLRFLSILANELSVALQNASRFDEIQQFNVRLQEEIDQATKELRSSNIKLKALDEAKDEFITMASHQLRTPLTSIKGYLSMILEGDVGNVSDKQKNMLDAAFTSSQRMVYLIADLLNVSRLRTGKFVIETSEVYLPDVVSGEVIQLVATAHARGIKIDYKKPKKFPKVMLDETKIRQVIMNFIDNAIYYNKDGGHITITLKATKDNIQYLVEDDGIGVPKQEQHKLFSKFFRAENARKARPDGTGLGLFMAKKVVVAQGGSIIFKSTPGKGSTFGFLFPLQKVEIKEAPKKKAKTKTAK